MNQRKGRKAQDAFKHMCSTADITCNPSLEDDYGWDFIVEIPSAPPADDMPSDKWAAAYPTFVQVKSTQGTRRQTEMKVSNALQLTKRPQPCFLVLFHQQESSERIYARLFSQRDMERTLKRAREISLCGQRAHKAKMTFRFSDDEERTSDLLEWMVSSVRALGIEYGSEKSQLAARIGYESRNWKVNITLGSTSECDDFVEMQLGLKEEIEISGFKVFDERFGLENPNPVIESSDGGTLRLCEPPRVFRRLICLSHAASAVCCA